MSEAVILHRVRLTTAFVAVVVAALAGCAAATSPRPSGETVVPITSIDLVKGKWAGLLERTAPSRRREEYIELVINGDGTYRFLSARTIGVLQGSGTLALSEGQLSSASEQGSATYRLVEVDGTRMLKVDAVTRDGQRFEARLRR
jgi:hypothetical protein